MVRRHAPTVKLTVGTFFLGILGAVLCSRTPTGMATVESLSLSWPADEVPIDARGEIHINSGLNDDSALFGLMRLSTNYESESFTKALQFVNSLKSAPSCARLVTSALLQSCQEVESPSHHAADENESTETILDQLKSTYAARLAICELVEAGATVPSECSSLMPPQPSKRDRKIASFFMRSKRSIANNANGVLEADTETLLHCLKSLESKPQWWTSYSNSRQNAVVICQAVRSQVERGQSSTSLRV